LNIFERLVKLLSVFGIRLLLLLVALALVLFTATVKADGPASCSFSGTVKLDGAEVPGATLITAIIKGDEYHTHTPPGLGSSSYSITIQAPLGKSYSDGTKVTFKINGYAADQTGVFQAGSSHRLDLTVSTGTVPANSRSATSLNVPLIVGVVFALLLAAGAVYYFVRRKRVNGNIIVSTGDRLTRGSYSSLGERPKKALFKPMMIDLQSLEAELEKKPEFEPPIAYPEGVLQALAVHGVPLQRTTPAILLVKCPACHQQYRIWVPDGWTVTKRAHLADGVTSYGKRTRSKWLFEFDLVCPEGHKLHLDWTWR
jgi:hypothetical protein